MPRMLFLLFINVKMPTVVGILTFMSRKKIMLSSGPETFLRGLRKMNFDCEILKVDSVLHLYVHV